MQKNNVAKKIPLFFDAFLYSKMPKFLILELYHKLYQKRKIDPFWIHLKVCFSHLSFISVSFYAIFASLQRLVLMLY